MRASLTFDATSSLWFRVRRMRSTSRSGRSSTRASFAAVPILSCTSVGSTTIVWLGTERARSRPLRSKIVPRSAASTVECWRSFTAHARYCPRWAVWSTPMRTTAAVKNSATITAMTTRRRLVCRATSAFVRRRSRCGARRSCSPARSTIAAPAATAAPAAARASRPAIGSRAGAVGRTGRARPVEGAPVRAAGRPVERVERGVVLPAARDPAVTRASRVEAGRAPEVRVRLEPARSVDREGVRVAVVERVTDPIGASFTAPRDARGARSPRPAAARGAADDRPAGSPLRDAGGAADRTGRGRGSRGSRSCSKVRLHLLPALAERG